MYIKIVGGTFPKIVNKGIFKKMILSPTHVMKGW